MEDPGHEYHDCGPEQGRKASLLPVTQALLRLVLKQPNILAWAWKLPGFWGLFQQAPELKFPSTSMSSIGMSLLVRKKSGKNGAIPFLQPFRTTQQAWKTQYGGLTILTLCPPRTKHSKNAPTTTPTPPTT